MTKLLFVFLLSLMIFGSLAQSTYKRPKPKNSFAQGTLDFSWGYNRSVYSKSNIRFVGNQYDFRLKSVKAHDRQEPFSSDYFNPRKFTVPQYNVRIGYNFKNFWNISFGFDHMKYIVKDEQTVNISGFVQPGADPLWSGYFNDGQERVLNKNHFQYQNTDGLNYVRLQLSRNLAPFPNFRDGNFAINWMYGVSTGAMVSFTDFTFEGYRSERISSISGYGLSLHTGLRFIFFKNFFLQTNFSGGFVHQVRAKTRSGLGNYASNAFVYGSSEGLLGFLWYLRPTNDCNSCPKW